MGDQKRTAAAVAVHVKVDVTAAVIWDVAGAAQRAAAKACRNMLLQADAVCDTGGPHPCMLGR